MSWMSNLVQTYKACEPSIGQSENDGNQRNMLLPIGHNLAEPNWIVTINDGAFVKAEECRKPKKGKPKVLYCMPCTEDSAARTNGAAKSPHPLFDQVKHLTGKLYLENLDEWIMYLSGEPEHTVAHAALREVYSYLEKGTLEQDAPDAKDGDMVFFEVYLPYALSKESRLWQMPELWNAWNSYIADGIKAGNANAEVLDYISGEGQIYTDKHPKSINRANGNAKLISGNDDTNFTYRGRFASPDQAVTVGYEASQMAHQALRWLISNVGFCLDTQAIVTWALDSTPNEVIQPQDDSQKIVDEFDLYDNDETVPQTPAAVIDKDYALAMRKAFSSSNGISRLREHTRRIAVMATDAATTGRLSVTYYQEFSQEDYHKHIIAWHNSCKWYQPFQKEQDGKNVKGHFVGAPSTKHIALAVLGKKRSRSDESYDKREKELRLRLLHCIFSGGHIPQDMLNAALHCASNPIVLEKKDAQTTWAHWLDWEKTLSVACALYRRHYLEKKEGYTLALDEKRTDRDYLYGRMLAVADKLEYYALEQKDRNRPTNALRNMQAFAQNPSKIWTGTIWNALLPYIAQLKGRAAWYQTLLDNISALFQDDDFVSNKSLGGAYLIGYYCQRKAIDDQIAIRAANKKKKEEDSAHESEQED